jgi:hypothetical protein
MRLFGEKKAVPVPEDVTLNVGEKYMIRLNNTDVAYIVNSGKNNVVMLSIIYSQWTYGNGRVTNFGYPIYLDTGIEEFFFGNKKISIVGRDERYVRFTAVDVVEEKKD